MQLSASASKLAAIEEHATVNSPALAVMFQGRNALEHGTECGAVDSGKFFKSSRSLEAEADAMPLDNLCCGLQGPVALEQPPTMFPSDLQHNYNND